jgi:hypothetical protein
MAKTSPTQRTLALLRKGNHCAAVAEHWQAIPKHPAGGVRKDLFGFIDIVALIDGSIVAIQCTSGSCTSARVKKILNERQEEARKWLECGGKIEVWGWRKLKKKVGNQSWFPKIVKIESVEG